MSSPTKHDPLADWRDEDGKLIAFAWPGGYPIFYLDGDNSTLCPDCANKADQDPDEFENFKPVAGDVYYEGPDLFCDQCNAVIESAYGDPAMEVTFTVSTFFEQRDEASDELQRAGFILNSNNQVVTERGEQERKLAQLLFDLTETQVIFGSYREPNEYDGQFV